MPGPKKKTTRKGTRTKAAAKRSDDAYKRLERELPPRLRDFSRRARRGLSSLERDIEKAEARTRRGAARLLREASHALGRFEAEGERRWRKLSAPARREAVRLLRRLERRFENAIAPRSRRA